MKINRPNRVWQAAFNDKTIIGIVSQTIAAVVFVTFISCLGPGMRAQGDGWWSSPVPVNVPGDCQHISDGAGGTFIAGAGGGPVYATRLNSAGEVVWGPLMLSVSNAICNYARLCSDGSGGAMVAWLEEQPELGSYSKVYVQRVSAGGVTQWAAPVAASDVFRPPVQENLAAAPGDQSMFLIYQTGSPSYTNYVVHISAAGVLSSPGVAGLLIDGFGAIVPAGGNSVVVVWPESGILAQKVVAASGAISKVWGSGSPVTICSDSGPNEFVESPSAAEDGLGNVLISWYVDFFSPHVEQVRVQKVNGDGVPQWTANGVVVVDSSVVGATSLSGWDYTINSAVASDGSGGAYVAWSDWRNSGVICNTNNGTNYFYRWGDVYAQRVNASGVPQWISGGICVDNSCGYQYTPKMVSDLAGGALLTYETEAIWNYDIAGARLIPTGVAWSEIISPSFLEEEDQRDPALIYDASGAPNGFIVVWTDSHRGLMARKVQIDAAANLAQHATGILGTESLAGIDTPVLHAGTAANINDGNYNTQVNTWNDTGTDPLSYVGILWPQPQATPVLCLYLTLATFLDGGWFGPNNSGPGPDGRLSPAYLVEPEIQVTTDGSATWTTVGHTSDYLTALKGHGIGGGTNPNPSSVTATFMLNTPVSGINGIRILGSEGGTASGGFLGVFDLAIYDSTDADEDGMADTWEARHGLNVYLDDAAADPDLDGLTNLQEYNARTDPQNADSDGDLFSDPREIASGSDPNRAASVPANAAFRLDATGFLGTMDSLRGTATPVCIGGSPASINDGLLNAAVTTNKRTAASDPLSYVGIRWAHALTSGIRTLDLTLATYSDGGWFGPNNTGPGAGGMLSASSHLVEPIVQVTSDRGATWVDVPFTSDYVTALDGHALPAVADGPPTLATARFTLTTPQTGINGVLIVGSEGGTASGGYLGVFELAVLTKRPGEVQLLNPRVRSGQLQFEFDSEVGYTHVVGFRSAVSGGAWQALTTIPGDGTRKTVTDALVPGPRFYYVVSY